MPWRLIQFIVIFAVFLLFIMFNLDNRSDLSLGFYTFRDVPVFLTAFFSFVCGLLLALPFMITLWLKARKGGRPAKKPGKRNGKKGAADKKAGDPKPEAAPAEPIPAEFKDFGID